MKKATTTMKNRKSGSKEGKGGDSPSQLIDARIKELSDWRVRRSLGSELSSRSGRGVEVERGSGMVARRNDLRTGETHKNVVKMTFAKGASLEDRSGLFNLSLDGNTRRAIDFHEGDKIDQKALKALIRAVWH
jgi:hypothetical protein